MTAYRLITPYYTAQHFSTLRRVLDNWTYQQHTIIKPSLYNSFLYISTYFSILFPPEAEAERGNGWAPGVSEKVALPGRRRVSEAMKARAEGDGRLESHLPSPAVGIDSSVGCEQLRTQLLYLMSNPSYRDTPLLRESDPFIFVLKG